MLGRPFRVNWRAEDSPGALKEVYLAERDVRLRPRLHGLWLLRAGRRLGDVASILGVHYRTVETWVGWYRRGGVDEVLSHRKGGRGRSSYLSEDQQAELVEEVSTGRFRTAGEIRDWIASEYGARYSSGGVYNLLARLGCTPKVPRGRHEKADADEQDAWKKGASVVPLQVRE